MCVCVLNNDPKPTTKCMLLPTDPVAYLREGIWGIDPPWYFFY